MHTFSHLDRLTYLILQICILALTLWIATLVFAPIAI